MKLTNLSTFVSFVVLIALIYFSFYVLMPTKVSTLDTPETEFSAARALIHLEKITKKPHYIGSEAHNEVREYLLTQLELIGLEPQVQEGFTLNKKWGVLSKPKNILARIPGKEQGKALMLLSHYDSAPHSFSHGASDAGSGVVAILEGVRAYLATGEVPKNDIIILFSDAEEIGLMGAKLFVEEHPWAKEVGLVINFEARGSGGPANMILESNGGNSILVKEFIKANPSNPVASSLMYSVYKLLPNDTDSTVFREEGDIDSFFFAFIDDFYDYHTVNDTFENLDRNTLEHQGSYVMAILNYFTKSDLTNLKAAEDSVYFNVPFLKMVSYPFSWIVPMLILAWLLFFGVVFFGISKVVISKKVIFRGLLRFVGVLVLCALLAFFGWKAILKIYPGYKEILHGFTYNGHLYIAAFVSLTLAICFWFYRNYHHKEDTASLAVGSLFIWMLINTAIAVYLKGAAFFIIPVFFALLSLLIWIVREKKSPLVFLIFATPAVFIFSPLIQFFSVGLGLKMLFISAIFTVLVFGLLSLLFISFRNKRTFAFVFLLIAIVFFIGAHFKSDFTENQQKPNSLVYFYDADTDESFWTTYDHTLDEWTKNYFDKNAKKASDVISNVTSSKYSTGYTFAEKAEKQKVPLPEIYMQRDTVIGSFREVRFTIHPQRKVNRLTLFADKEVDFRDFEVNGLALPKSNSSENALENRSSTNLLSYYVSDSDSLEVFYRVQKDVDASIILQEISFDLLENKLFTIPNRNKNRMPKPFITTDAVIVQLKIGSKNRNN
ncbi:MAG: peptidase M28 [Bacteroidetes bacterium HGW-Bacteroidetes-2]|nr:MAG: peptidase M28 [Bacteroidetes bacterium HGW-Bacteroidetes-2]